MKAISLITIVLCIFYINVHSQSLSLFDIDTTNFPIIKAKFYAFDKDGNQITNLSPSDFELKENGQARNVTKVSCPTPKPLKKLSVAMSIDVSASMNFGNFSNLSNIPIALGLTSARELCNLVAMPPSEFALQTCDHEALIVQDFTTNKSKILASILPIYPRGDNDFEKQLLNKFTGLLNIAKTGKYKKVAVLYTDALWYALTQQELQQCKDTCSKYNIQFYAVIYSSPEAEPNGIKKSLKELANFTNGFLYDGVTTIEAAQDISLKLQQTAQGGEPCDIIWESGTACPLGITNVELNLLQNGAKSVIIYQTPNSSIAKLEFNPTSITFENPLVGVKVEQKVTISARNANFTVTNITSNNAAFVINPKSFVLNSGQSIELTVSFFPADSGYNYCKFEVENNNCLINYYVSGGWKGKQPTIRTIKLIHPNGGEVFVAGSDTVITWEGVTPDEYVKIQYRTADNQPWITIKDSAKGLIQQIRVPNVVSKKYLTRITASADVRGFDNDMVLIPAGTFQMGNTGYFFGEKNEKNVRTITISRDFLMSRYEITQQKYQEVMKKNPSYRKDENLPVEKVSWYDAIEFCNALSDLEGLDKCYSGYGYGICNWNANGYRLPTEAEWEYACKAGTNTDFYNGNLSYPDCSPKDANLDKIGWYCGNSGYKTNKVGQKEPNSFGLYDMSGNVWEWCWDWYEYYDLSITNDPTGPSSGTFRTVRGGSWGNEASRSRSSYRLHFYPEAINYNIGFRIIRSY